MKIETLKKQFAFSVKSRRASAYNKTYAAFSTQKDRDGFVLDMLEAGYNLPLNLYKTGAGRKLRWCVGKSSGI